MLIFFVIICGFLLYFLPKCIGWFRIRRILKKIPQPPGHWLIGNLEDILKNSTPEALFHFVRQCNTNYFPIYQLRTPYVVVVNILHPGDFEIILSQMKHLKKSRLYEFLSVWLGEGLLTSSGSKWQKRRKMLTKAFHFSILQKFLNIFIVETQNMVGQIEEINKKSTDIHGIDIIPIITEMTLQSMAETSLGIANVDEKTYLNYRNNIYKIGELLLKKIFKPWREIKFIYAMTKDYKVEQKTVRELHNFTYEMIKKREEQFKQLNDDELSHTSYSGRKIMKMLDILLQEKINGGDIDYEGIREEVDTFMFEGHDTTSAALTFLLYTLSKYPDVQEQVRNEIITCTGINESPSYQDLQRLDYTDRVIKENLRLYPSVPFIARVASEDFVSHTGYHIPKGAVLHMHIYDLHRNPHIFKDPETFDPDRFLPEHCLNRHPFSYLPFSAGPRNCIGQKFALLEIKSVLAGILKKFRLVHDDSSSFTFQVDLVLRIDGDIKIKFYPLI